MTSAAPWSVKGIDPKAREIAKGLARRSGMTLGEWINQRILEDSLDGDAVEPPRAARPAYRSEAAPTSDYGQRSALGRRLEAPPAEADQPDEHQRLTEALDRLSARIETAELRSTLAISGVDQSVQGVLARIDGAEREQTAVAARFETAVDEVRAEHAATAERLRRLEQDRTSGRSTDALRALELALTKVANHLYEGENRTREALDAVQKDVAGLVDRVQRIDTSNDPDGSFALVESVVSRIAQRLEKAEARTADALNRLEGSFASLDGRLGAAEERLESPAASPLEHRFEQLAADLTQKVDQVRLDMAESLKAAADGRADRVEGALREMAGHVQAAERRSASAIERMGQEVLRMADSLSQRVQGAEARNAEAIEQVGGDVARIADSVETRLKRADFAQAEALEKLGGEIARITERLAERIANAERRSAHAMDDVGEQITRVTDRFNQRHERSSSELLDRMRQSEERTARLLDEAREKIDQRLSEAQKRLGDQIAAAPPPAPAVAPAPSPYDPYAVGPFGSGPFGQAAYVEPEPPLAYEPAPPASDPPAPAYEAGLSPYEPSRFADSFEDDPSLRPQAAFDAAVSDPHFAESDFDAADEFVPIDGAPTATAAATPDYEPAAARGVSTRELVAAARAAARAASQPQDGKGRKAGGLFGAGRKKSKRDGGSMKTALMASAVAASLGVCAAGVMISNGDSLTAMFGRDGKPTAGSLGRRLQIATDEAKTPAAAVPVAAATDATAAPGDPQMAIALATPAGPGMTAAPIAGGLDLQALYNSAVTKIETHQPSGLDDLRKAANLAYAPAQLYLGKLYEDGQAGLAKDMTEARRWTERAAENGDARAMHNLGVYYFNGSGGVKNKTLAAQWFRKAADRGLVDSQYNLASLYESGVGVGQNGAEAYKWYLIAGRSGDGESRAAGERMKKQLSAEEQAAAERAAAAYRSTAAVATAQAAPMGVQAQAAITTAQQALSRLGYYQGPADGAASPALKYAIAAYQKDQGLPATGSISPDLLQRFQTAAR